MIAQNVIDRVTKLLIDEGSVRWTIPELLLWITDAQRDLVALKPSAYALTTTFALNAGSRQELPPVGQRLIEITHNVASGRAVRIADRERLDEIRPYWHSDRQRQDIQHYMLDDRNPKTFWVYPPSDGTTVLSMTYSLLPPLVTSGAQTLVLDEAHLTALVNYVMFRALSKDADFALNVERAQFYLMLFTQQVAGKTETEGNWSPNVRKVANG